MSFPYSAEGRIEIFISSPEKARFVSEGIERWVRGLSARDVHWKEDCLHFSGDVHLMKSNFHPLNRVGDCEVRFTNLPDRVVMDYSVSFLPFPYLLFAVAAFFGVAVSGIGDPRRLLLLPLVVAVSVAFWMMGAFEFRSNLQLAATRALADAAVRELAGAAAR